MVQANKQPNPVPLSALFRNPILVDAFRRAEKGGPPSLPLLASSPIAPVLSGDAACAPELV